MKFLLPLLVFTFRAHAFIADFLAIFDSYVLENVIYETVSFPSHVDENDFNSELAIRLAQNVPFSAKIRKEVKTLSLLEFSNAMNIDKSVGEQRGQFIKDPFETFLLYTAVDIKHLLANMTFYAELKSLFPMQPFMFSLSHHDEKSNAYEVHELQIFARRSIKLAQWDQQEKSIEYMNTNAIKRRQNLSGVELTTCHESEMPFFSFDKDTGDYLGSTGSILALFQKKFQFSILWSNFSAFGGITENGSRTGVIGDLLQEKLDFSGVDMINSDDRRDISFGFTLVTTTQFLWFHKTKQSNSDWFALLGVFDPLFWAAVASVMIVCFLTLQLANSKKYRAKGCSPMEFSVMSFSFVVKSFLGQSHDESQLFLNDGKKPTFLAISVFSMSLCGALVFMSYSSCLTSVLAVQSFTPPFSSLNEMQGSTSFKLYTFGSSSASDTIYLKATAMKELMAVFKNKIEPYLDNFEEFFEAKDPNSAALMGDVIFAAYAKKAHANPCNFHQLRFKDVVPDKDGWMYPKNSVLQPLFDDFMQELTQSGVIQQIREANMKMPLCEDTHQFKEISFDFVKIIFALLGSGVGFAIVISVMEKLHFISNSAARP